MVTVAVLASAFAVAPRAIVAQTRAGASTSSAGVSAAAVGAPAPSATPIGGLTTRPIPSGSNIAVPGLSASGGAMASRRVLRGGPVLVGVADAPLTHGGVVVYDDDASPNAYAGVRWTLTADAPHWQRDPRVRPVDAWRDLIVTDVVCSTLGECRQRQRAVRAPWVARCGCYAFADGWNRWWRVE